MPADITEYTSLITSEHADKPKFMATVEALVQPVADIRATLESLPAEFDVDTAAGAQLDIVGLWVGSSRRLQLTIDDVFFSFNIDGLGFNQGVWLGRFDPTTGLTVLPDDVYRALLKFLVFYNTWDGVSPYISDSASVFISDPQDMSEELYFTGDVDNALLLKLFQNGFFDLKPAGVRIAGRHHSSATDLPIFGFGPESPVLGGFGDGAWMVTP